MQAQNRISFVTFVAKLGKSRHGNNVIIITPIKLRNYYVLCKNNFMIKSNVSVSKVYRVAELQQKVGI